MFCSPDRVLRKRPDKPDTESEAEVQPDEDNKPRKHVNKRKKKGKGKTKNSNAADEPEPFQVDRIVDADWYYCPETGEPLRIVCVKWFGIKNKSTEWIPESDITNRDFVTEFKEHTNDNSDPGLEDWIARQYYSTAGMPYIPTKPTGVITEHRLKASQIEALQSFSRWPENYKPWCKLRVTTFTQFLYSLFKEPDLLKIKVSLSVLLVSFYQVFFAY